MRSNAKIEIFNLDLVEERMKGDDKRLQVTHTKDRDTKDYFSFPSNNRALLEFCETAILRQVSCLLLQLRN